MSVNGSAGVEADAKNVESRHIMNSGGKFRVSLESFVIGRVKLQQIEIAAFKFHFGLHVFRNNAHIDSGKSRLNVVI